MKTNEELKSSNEELLSMNQNLEIRERILRLVTDAIPALIAYIDTELHYKYCNAAYHEWFGLQEEDIIGKKVPEVLGEESYAEVRSQMEQALAGESVQFTTTLNFRNRGEKIVSIRYEPHIIEDGKIHGVIIYAQDESERILRERKLGRLAAIMESTHEVIIGKTDEGIITDWNKRAEELYGYSAEEAVGRHISFIVPPDKMGELESAREQLAAGENVAPFETVRLTRTGEKKHVLLSLAVIRDEKDEPLGISTVAHDITDRVLMENELEAANTDLERRVKERTDQLHKLTARFLSLEQRERRRFAEYLHDEIQQSVAAARLMLEQAYSDADEEKVSPSLSEALRLLNEVIAHTRSITMDMSPPLFFETGIAVCLQWLKRWAQAKLDIQIEAEVIGTDRPVADEAGYLLYRSLRELIYNIQKHAGVKEANLKATYTDDGALKAVLTDHGRGFDLQTVMSANSDHFGVLSVKEQVKAMTGSMSIDTAEGRGTQVVISLPAEIVNVRQKNAVQADEQMTTVLDNDNPEKMHDSDGKKVILIVDDQEDLRFTLRLMLEEISSNYIFLEAEEASQAIEVFRQYRPHLVLMDVSMPGMSGVEATRKIKALNTDAVVIGLSMHEREDMEKAMREAGAAHYLTKDSASEKILAIIEECLEAGESTTGEQS